MKSLDNTIIIFQKPELYFFPLLEGKVFAPFRIPEKSIRYLLYKFLYLLRIPACSVFWGDWRKQLSRAENVILFDYGYQRGMESYIKKVNPGCRVYLFMWNKIDRVHHNHLLYSDKNGIYSTDPGDCREYGLHYNHIFYLPQLHRPYLPSDRDSLFFLGADKGRGEFLLKWKKLFEKCGLPCDIRILGEASKQASASLRSLYTPKPLDYRQYLQRCEECTVLLDIPQAGQRALTLRVLEAVFLSKKLITSNAELRNYEFYNENNILILPQNPEELSPETVKDFLKREFLPYPAEVLERYGISDWLNRFLP